MTKVNKQPAASQAQEPVATPESAAIKEPVVPLESAAIQEPREEKDEFCSTEFIDPDAKLPRIQALRGTSNDTCGYFVGIEQMASAGWLDFNEKQIITYIFESSGEQEQGILIKNPRMLVCPKTPVLGFDRKQSQELNNTVILGRYAREMREDENIGNLQYYQVFLLDGNNQPMHQIPFSYKANGKGRLSTVDVDVDDIPF